MHLGGARPFGNPTRQPSFLDRHQPHRPSPAAARTSLLCFIMPLLDYTQYVAGFVPYEDVGAQLRCFAYIKKAVALLDHAIAQDPTQDKKNLRSLFLNLISMVDVASGSRRLARANTFWRYWDKSKQQIIEVVEGTSDPYLLQNKVAELEDGRYIQA